MKNKIRIRLIYRSFWGMPAEWQWATNYVYPWPDALFVYIGKINEWQVKQNALTTDV